MAIQNRLSIVDRLRSLWKGPTGIGVFYLGAGRGQYIGQSWDFTRVANSVYGNPTGYRCVEAIVANFSRPPWVVYPAGTDWPTVGEAQPVKNSGALKLLQKPNVSTSGTMMQRLIARDLELTGKAFWIKWWNQTKPLSQYPPIDELRRLPPQKVTVVGNQDHELLGFVYVDGMGRQVPVLPENMVYLRYPHPERAYDGLAPALIAGLPAETDTASTRFNRRLLDNDSALPGYMVLDGVSPADFAQWKAIWEAGEPGKTRFIGGQQSKYFKVGQTNQELTYAELRQDSQDDVMRSFGVPRAVAFDVSHETYANAEREQEIFMQQSILPKWSLICDEITLQISPNYQNAISVGLNLAGIDELNGSRDAMVERNVRLILIKAKTINEFRREMGWKDVDWGDEPQAPLQQMSAVPMQPGGDTEDGVEPAPSPIKTAPKTPAPPAKPAPKPATPPKATMVIDSVEVGQNGNGV